MDDPAALEKGITTEPIKSSKSWDFLKTFGTKLKNRTEAKPHVYPESPALVQEARNQLIDKILTGGLKSSETVVQEGGQFLGSIDKESMPYIFGRDLKPVDQYHDQATFRRALDQVLYMGDSSCLPVVTERPGESAVQRHLVRSTKAERDEISRRASSSFLVVCKSNSNSDYARTEDQTKPGDFAYVVFPEQVLSEYGADKLAQKGLKIASVSRVVKRSLLMGDPVDIPDYEGALEEIVQELNSPIWVHAVRLPLKEDLEKSGQIQK